MPPWRTLAGELDEPVELERPEVVVDLLAGDPEAGGQRRRRRRLGQLGEQPGADGVERHDGGGRALDHLDVVHGRIVPLDKIVCQDVAGADWISDRRRAPLQARVSYRGADGLPPGAQDVKVGITTFCLDRTVHPVRMAQEVEGRGFESLWYPEHSHIPASRRSPWPGSLTGEPLPDDYWRMHDQFNALAMAGAVTTRLRLGTSVTLLGQRDPIWTAKQIASLDHLTDGRVMVGIGFGWNREEQENHGYRWADRRAMVREKVLAMRALWTEDEASFDGEHVHIEPAWACPKPVQQPSPPVYLGGGSGPRLFEAIADYGDGWLPITARPSLAGPLQRLRDAAERAGRDPAALAVSVFGATTDPAGLEQLAAEGVDRAVLTLPYEGIDVVAPMLDEWAPLVERLHGTS